MGEAHAKEAAARLRTVDYRKGPTVGLNPQRSVRAIPAPAGIQPDEVKADLVEEAEHEVELLSAEAKEPAKVGDPWGFIYGITRNGRHRKLRHVGDCRLISGIHYLYFEVWGDKLPGEGEIDSRCGGCFPTSEAKRAVQDELGSDGESDSSSSSSAGDGGCSKRRREPFCGRRSLPISTYLHTLASVCVCVCMFCLYLRVCILRSIHIFSVFHDKEFVFSESIFRVGEQGANSELHLLVIRQHVGVLSRFGGVNI